MGHAAISLSLISSSVRWGKQRLNSENTIPDMRSAANIWHTCKPLTHWLWLSVSIDLWVDNSLSWIWSYDYGKCIGREVRCEERKRDTEKKAREKKESPRRSLGGKQQGGRGTTVGRAFGFCLSVQCVCPHPWPSEKTGWKVSSAPDCINIWPKTPLHREEGFGLGRPLSVPFDLWSQPSLMGIKTYK